MGIVALTALGVGGATAIGALIGFLFKNPSHKFNDMILSFAAGVMLAAAVLGLIIPSIDYGGGGKGLPITIIGIFLGAMTVNALDKLVPHLHKLSGVDPEKRLKSIDYIQKSLWAAELLGANTIVIHSGSAAKISREEAMRLSCDTLEKVIEAIGDTSIKLGIETMGKVNQLGTLDEVIEQCRVDKHYVPVVDFGHMNSREQGLFRTADDYRRIFDKIASGCSPEVAKNLHCHFSKIQYTDKGEKCPLTFEDNIYGPDFAPLAEVIARDSLSPRIICESAGTQAEDALAMKNTLKNLI